MSDAHVNGHFDFDFTKKYFPQNVIAKERIHHVTSHHEGHTHLPESKCISIQHSVPPDFGAIDF